MRLHRDVDDVSNAIEERRRFLIGQSGQARGRQQAVHEASAHAFRTALAAPVTLGTDAAHIVAASWVQLRPPARQPQPDWSLALPCEALLLPSHRGQQGSVIDSRRGRQPLEDSRAPLP